ncbi:hypothetical protein [Ruminococcus sp. Marseille-P6503]|uniref:hypothetical protein n=1 Tax=Ruminococcus sp. Marseille-P6503 TaxID=2364796 RepID=UPI000F5240D2|nr:hypothetical protein [Ruminococcus sp. Marseille-P6503]
MIQTPSNYQNRIVSEEFEGSITLSGGTNLGISSDNIVQNSVTLTESCCSGSFMVGGVISNQLDMALILEDPSSLRIQQGSAVYLVKRYILDDDDEVEFCLGHFIIDISSIKKTANTMSFTAYDYMSVLDAPIKSQEAQVLRRQIPSRFLLYITSHFSSYLSPGYTEAEILSLPNGGEKFTYEYKDNDTYRDLLGWVAQLLGVYFRIDRQTNTFNYGRFAASTAPSFIINGDNAIKRSISDTRVRITGARFGDFQVGEDGVLIDLTNNPLLPNKAQNSGDEQYVEAVFNAVKNIDLYTAEIAWFGDLAVEPGDRFTYLVGEGASTKAYTVTVMETIWRSRGSCTIRSFSLTGDGKSAVGGGSGTGLSNGGGNNYFYFAAKANLPSSGLYGRLYVVTDENVIYRWSEKGYVNAAQTSGTEVITLASSAAYANKALSLPFTPNANTRIAGSLRYAGSPNPSRYYVLSFCYISSKIYANICSPQYTGPSGSLPAGTYYVDWTVLDRGEAAVSAASYEAEAADSESENISGAESGIAEAEGGTAEVEAGVTE